ncbi:hypothetical protein [Pyxidicoccus trucidator]|uniref:hypothetical protein n=1 Tax=Pyxidicoccus trucidator TaxID=2709662 RepID=UPI0013DC74B5|nr:hypothetical protein [Pyxidicoccus trucidator]
MPTRPSSRGKSVLLLLASALLAACAGSPHRAPHGELRFVDTETAGRLRHAAAVGRGAGGLSPVTSRTVASLLVELVPILVTVLTSDLAVVEFQERLVECARLAERRVNASHFGNRAPTRQECGEEVEVDGCGARVTRAMQLGQQKHEVALQCAREALEELWPGQFSLEQRYRYYPNARMLESVSREEEARLIAQRCTRELWRTIKPDLVLHAGGNLLRSLLTLDFKFPCPDTNEPRWTRYGKTSAYFGFDQREIYKEALGGEALMISPQTGVTP